jgi:ornithine cyclodeaminase/alanine dehydrogenase-like protein (mu-crystallin family)
MPVLLTEKDVRDVLFMDNLIAAMAAALDRFSAGSVRQPLRSVVDIASRHAFFGVMPAFIDGSAPALGTKLVSVYHSNLARGLPSHLATIALFDPDTGALRALVDGRYITEARTAAASAAATQHLARADARVLAVFGSGVQARSHIDALVRVRPIEEIRVWGRDAMHVDQLIDELTPVVRPRMRRAESARDAAREADVIALVTASPDPVLSRDCVKEGTHINAVGACRPNQREMDTALVKAARVFVDSRVGAFAEAGDIVIPIKEGAIDESHIAGEIGDVCGGRTAGRRSAQEITIFKSLGMAVEDVAAAHLAFERASERGLGRGFVL